MSAVILPFPIFHVRIVREGSYPQDRASVLATTLISIVVRHLRAPEVHAEIAQTLREEFYDIARQARDETRPSGE
jgi:hypothetical protein